MNKFASLLRFDFLPASADLGLLLLRVWFGTCMLALHGIRKLASFDTLANTFGDPIGIGPTPSLVLVIFAEVLCAFLLVLGLFTRFAALSCLITMSVAFFIAHGAALSGERSGLTAFLYLGVFVTLFITGGGRFALDARLGNTTAAR